MSLMVMVYVMVYPSGFSSLNDVSRCVVVEVHVHAARRGRDEVVVGQASLLVLVRRVLFALELHVFCLERRVCLC